MSNSYPGGLLTTGADTSYSVAFDGTGDYLTVPNNAVFNFGSGDFTLEAWVYVISKPSTYSWFIHHGDSATAGGSAWSIGLENNTLNLSLYSGGTGTGVNSTITTWNYNTWVHVAATRSGNTIRLFANGVLVKTDTYSSTLNSPTSVINIGSGAGGDSRCNAYISNARVVNGTAVYTTAFTPPTQLFPVPGTSLLVCQSPTLIDKSNNNFTITANGDAKVSTFTPFTGYKGFNPALGAAAGGVWTLEQASSYQSNRTWPIYDPYFNQTTLLLHGNGANTATNSSFTDSSSNNFDITRNGNTTQGTFSPFSPTGWSNYLNSNNDEGLSYPTAANTVVGCPAGTKLTYEFWIYCSGILNETGYYMALAGASPSIGVNGRWAINFIGSSTTSDQYLYYYWTTGTGSADTAESTVPLKQNRWNHVAICIDATTASSSTIVIYQNGIGQTFTNKNLSTQTTANDPGYQQYIGGRRDDGSQTWNGYVKDFRVVRGSLVYTSNFTPPTAPLTAIPGTVLLTCQDNRFVDNSPYNWTMGAVSGTGTTGKPSTQAFSPYVPAYITPTTYSNWFDGTGDYLTVPNAAWMNLGTSDFTMECWTQFNTVGLTQMFVSNNYNAGNGAGGWAFLYRQDNTTLVFTCNSNVAYGKTFAPVVGRWYHVAVCRSGTDLRLFVDGTQIGTTSTSSDSITGASSSLFVGSNETNALPINGLISNLRIVKGTALYTTNFTPSSSPLTAITNTQLLTCQDSTFKDNSVNAASFTAYGNVQPVSSPTPFPANVDTTTLNSAYSTSLVGGSGYFDGSGDYLSVSSAAALQLTTSTPFTIEAWVYPTALGGDCGIIGKRPGSSGAGVEWQFFFKDDKTLHLYNGTNDYGSGTAISGVNQWVHAAVSWDLTTLRFFLNGVLCSSTYTGISLGAAGSSVVTVGGDYPNGELWTGYLNGVRLVKGTALYTSSFAPPVAPSTPVTNTSLLLNYTNAGIIDNTAKNTFETVGTAQLSSTQAKYGGTSMKFDGSISSFLKIPFNQNLNISTGAPDFTLECWVYVNSFTNAPFIFNKGGLAAANYTNYGFAVSDAGLAYMHLGNNGGESSYNFGTISTGVWYHLAGTRQGSTIRSFLNGVLITSSSIGTTMTDNGQELFVGCLKNLTTNVLNGFVNDLRITKGYARYTTNFTPPTSALQNQ